ncbi:MAG: helix-turn-helix domain-containing protein [Candidatus Hodarchaeales archaeon]
MADYSMLKSLFNLNQKEYIVLQYLFKTKKDNAKGIAHNTGIDVPRVYECLKRLENMDLIIKQGDWSAYFEINKTIVQRIAVTFKENEEKRQKQIQSINKLIHEVSSQIDLKTQELTEITILKAPFTRLFAVENDPDQFIDFYMSWGSSTEINLCQTPNQFLQAIQRFNTFSVNLREKIAEMTATIKNFRVIITDKIDGSALEKYVNSKHYIEFLGSLDKTITIRELNFNQLKFLFGLSDREVFFPVCKPDDSLIGIVSSNDFSLVETYRSYFWDRWSIAIPKYQLENNEVVLL